MILHKFWCILFSLALSSVILFTSCSKFCDDSSAENALKSGEGLRVGVALSDINPDEINGTVLDGYDPRTADGLHDPLTIRCLVIMDDDEIVALISLDLIGMFKIHSDKIRQKIVKETGLSEDHIFIHSIHTHSGPEMLNLGLSNISYRNRIGRKAANAVLDALAANMNVTAIFHSGYSDAGTINRRYPENPVTNKFTTIEFQDTTHATVATLLNFACHPVVLGPDNRKISADYVYYLRNRIGNEKGGMAVFFNGSFGDINPPPIHSDWLYGRDGGTFLMAEEFGEQIADDMLSGYETSDTASIDLRVATRKCILNNGIFPDPFTYIAILDLGIAQIAMVPGEPLTGFSETIESLLPGPYTMVFGNVNDYFSYIIPDEEWETCTYTFLDNGCYEESKARDRSVAGILEQGYRNIADDMFGASF